jgi:hypothetical protein
MLLPAIQTKPLDFDLSLYDFFDGFSRYRTLSTSKIQYEYKTLTLKEPVGAIISVSELIHYPVLAKQIRKCPFLRYQTSIDLSLIETYEKKGLTAIIDSLKAINEALFQARTEKAKLDSQINNLLYLYGQTRDLPILQEVKPYFYRSYSIHRNRALRLKISGVYYWINYHSKRFGKLTDLYMLNEHDLLADYFEKTKKNVDAINRCCKLNLLGGILNTPIYAFLVRMTYKHKGKKYYVDLSDNKTYTRLTDVKEKARTYTQKYEPCLFKE